MTTPSVLSIAGLDPSGGAGILADVEVFSQLGVRSFAVATALTGQSSVGVSWVKPVSPSALEAQLAPLLADFFPGALRAIKIGMLGSLDNISRLAQLLAPLSGLPIVLDPVLVSSSGHPLLEPGGIEVFCQKLLPLAQVLTPNLEELALLSGVSRERPEEGARVLFARGARAVLVKGGHAEGDLAEDLLYEGEEITAFSSPRVSFPPGVSTVRGTGCRLSSAIAAKLALGLSLREAVGEAKRLLDERFAAGVERLGRGSLGYFRPR